VPRPIANPPNPWLSTHVEYAEDLGAPPDAKLEVYEDRSKSILSKNDSPDLGFRWSINPYRGCYHGCAYCYARPTHEYLGFGAGTDFERKIIVKLDAAELLRERFERPAWTGETLMFSGVTDCYQPLEAAYGLTRACLEVCAEYRNPVSIITKGALVRRDVDLLARLAREASASVALSLAFNDDELARAIEPWASPPSRRLAAIAALAEAGVDVGISLSPIIPGLNDDQIPAILGAAQAAGARWAFMTLLRLPGSVLPVFEQRIREAVPLRAAKVLHAIEDMSGGQRNRSGFGARMRGTGPRWAAIEAVFDTHRRRLGLAHASLEHSEDRPATFRRPRAQRELFE
jgi:DNA repair photolyase